MARPMHEVFAPGFDRRPLAARPYLVAEAGVNHEGSLPTAHALIDQAVAGGADAIKFQTYKADTLAVVDSPAYWDLSQEPSTSQHALFKRFDAFGETEYRALKAHCDEVGIAFMSTPFDVGSARLLDELVDVHKIASSDITNRPLVELIASFEKPILLSTGASDLGEIGGAVDWIVAQGAPLALLHCVLNYPTAEPDAALGRIVALRAAFPSLVIGYSDHTLPADLEVPLLAAALGACVIEKHFSHDVTLPGNDHYHALDQASLRRLVERLERAVTLVGTFELDHLGHEDVSRRHARRSLVTARFVAAGTRLTRDDLTWKRPGHGVSPADIERVLGRTVIRDLEPDTIVQWDQLV